jgi:hypothetical protein
VLETSLVKSISAEIFLLVVCLVLLGRIGQALSRQLPIKTVPGMHAGNVVLQFVLLLPLLLTTLLVTLQIALIVQAKFVVNYAAFCAVRSAVVVIPAGVRSKATGEIEKAGIINTEDRSSPKLRIIRRAAALACAGISPPASPGLTARVGFVPDLTHTLELEKVSLLFAANVGATNVSQQLVARAPYALADDNTKVSVSLQSARQGEEPYVIITAHVSYRYYLTVPIADRLFGKAFFGPGLFGRSAFFISVEEEYSLPASVAPLFPEATRPDGFYEIEDKE